MASADLSRRVEKVVGYPPLSELGERQRREFHEELLDARQLRGPAREMAGGDPGGGTEAAQGVSREPHRTVPDVSPSASSRSAAIAAKPVKEPLPTPEPSVFPAGAICPFPLLVETLT